MCGVIDIAKRLLVDIADSAVFWFDADKAAADLWSHPRPPPCGITDDAA